MGALIRRVVVASTLIETLIASVIFLCVFMISLDTLSRLTLNKTDTRLLTEADYRIKDCFREYATGKYDCGYYQHTFDWGSIGITVKPYRDYPALRELEITADIKRSGKQIRYRHLINNCHE